MLSTLTTDTERVRERPHRSHLRFKYDTSQGEGQMVFQGKELQKHQRLQTYLISALAVLAENGTDIRGFRPSFSPK